MDICHTAQKSDVNVILCTVATNLRECPPFASLQRASITEVEKKKWEDLYGGSIILEDLSKYSEAIQRYLDAERIDDGYADLQFRLGRCYLAIGEYDKAGERYIKARDLDTLRLHVLFASPVEACLNMRWRIISWAWPCFD
ncbi:MAG: tetratricopeptide repeat protein [bacterium]